MGKAWLKSNRPNNFHLEANKMLSKGYLYHLLRVNDLEHEDPYIDSVSIVNEFQDVS